jgi:hypothetical protein
MNNLHIITVATNSENYFTYLKESCKKNGKELIVLAYGEKWKGFNWRFKLVLNYLKTLNKDDIVCFIDGYDVLCTRNLNQLKDVFFKLKNKYNCKIIIGEHKKISNDFLSSTHKFLIKNYFGQCKNLSLNAGTYIAQVKDLLEILEKIYNIFPVDGADDQILFTKYCNRNPNDIYIDSNNEIFLTLESPYKEIDTYIEFKKNNNKVSLYYNNNSPFFVHGPGETYLDNIIINMNYYYDYNNKINKKLKDDFYKKAYFRFINSIINKICLIVIFVLFIIFLIYMLYKKNILSKYSKYFLKYIKYK